MKVCKTIDEFLKEREKVSGSVALVPTMGALHEGHIALIERGRKIANIVIVSIFVNPTQFGEGEDFESYPNENKKDLDKCDKAGVDVVFMPEVKDIYKSSADITMSVGNVSKVLCGAKRKGHFDGVVQIVSILFNIVRPAVAIFGEKDYQQLLIIKKLVQNFCYPIKIISVPTVREKSMLAKSSRNSYLTKKQRDQAANIHKAMLMAKDSTENCKNIIIQLEQFLTNQVENSKVDYIKIVNENNLKEQEFRSDHSRIFIALFVGKARLIDNWHIGA